jgi:hypothetical protein
MSVSARIRLAGTWAGALGALLACNLLVPSRAQAGCSHYAIQRAAIGELDRAAGMLALALPDEASTPWRPAPCSGPSCSGRTDSPTPPSVATTRFVEPWACLPERWMSSDQCATPLDADSRRLRPIHRGEPHPRPPRSAESHFSHSIA